MYLHKTKNGHYTPPCCYFSGELEVVEILRVGFCCKASNTRRRNIAYAIPVEDGRFYTERNFSFGEIVLLNLLYDIHNVSNGSLVLIDELELALHPSAQIRLLSCLKEMADEKGLTILITTHSASLIRSQKDVILLEEGNESGQIDVMYHCPPAKAIGAIGMREDTMPDIVILVEDDMAKALFMELKRKYFSYYPEQAYLDIRVLEIGGYKNVINFYVEANNYVFYDNVFVTAFMDKDVETDVIPYPQYGNQEDIQRYHDHSRFLKFLPYTPEVLLVKTYIERKQQFLQSLSMRSIRNVAAALCSIPMIPPLLPPSSRTSTHWLQLPII